MSEKKEILAVGSIAFDSIETPNGNREKILGGSATYFGVSASQFSAVSLIGIVGDDFTKSDWNIFKKYKINTESIEIAQGKTFSWGGKYNSDYSHRETLFTNLGVFENFVPNINKEYNQPILYLGNIQPELQLDVINKIDNASLVIADTMNLWIDLSTQKVWDLISKVNIFMINDEEAMQLTNDDNLDKIADLFLSKGPEIVIIKKGSLGSLLAYENNKINISVVPNTKLVDPTGAGDSFAGGVLGYIANHGIDNPVEAVKYGTAVASFTVSGFGLENLYKIEKSELLKRIGQIKWN
tara:strand:- start:990 stop:1880 length:891 start_codon:yes stop_codon:yes gene_type:complete